jgi:hypothetical protein
MTDESLDRLLWWQKTAVIAYAVYAVFLIVLTLWR